MVSNHLTKKFSQGLKQKLLFAVLVLNSIHFIGCTADMAPDYENENIVGSKLEAVSSMRDSNGAENNTIALFDPTLKKIHQFDVVNMKKLRTLKVRFPHLKHFVLHDPQGNYIIDLSEKGVSIFDKDNKAVHDPVPLIARPQSAALNATLGYLVIYDERMNIGLVQLGASGQVLKSLGLGPVIGGHSIASGDLLSNGVLALTLSDGSLASVDIADTFTQGQWSATIVTTGFSSISWLAPVPSNTNRVFVKHSDGVALIDRLTGATVTQVTIDGSFSFVKLSKYVDGHVVVKNWNNELRMYYTDGAAIRSRAMFKQNYGILRSQLDLTTDSWMMVGAQTTSLYNIFSGDINVITSARKMNRFRASDLRLSESQNLPDKAQVFMSLNYFFALYSSDLGFAVKQNYNTGVKTEMRGFNVPEFDK